VLAAVAGAATATDTVTVRLSSAKLGDKVGIELDGSYYKKVWAGRLEVEVTDDDGAIVEPAFCVDLHESISSTPFTAELVAPEYGDPMWCPIAWIVNEYDPEDALPGSTTYLDATAMQVAFWKLAEHYNPAVSVDLTTTDSDVEDRALDMLAAAKVDLDDEDHQPYCPMTCVDGLARSLSVDGGLNSDGLVEVTLTLREDGQPVYGQRIEVWTDVGKLVSRSGEWRTDIDGQVTVLVDLEGGTTPPTITASAHSQWVVEVVPLDSYQNLGLTSRLDPCSVEVAQCIELGGGGGVDLGPAQPYNAFVCGDYTGALDIGGKVAVAGSATFTGFSVAWADPGGDALIAGEDLDLRYGTVFGNAWYGGVAYVEGVTYDGGALVEGTPIDFDDQCAVLEDMSLDLGALPATGSTTFDGSNRLFLEGTEAGLNVFEVDATEISAMNTLFLEVPDGAQVLVNVSGVDVAFHYHEQFITGVSGREILWNLTDASDLEIYAVEVEGSVLAPLADAQFNAGAMNGTLVAKSVTGYGELHSYLFTGLPSGDFEECPTDDEDGDGKPMDLDEDGDGEPMSLPSGDGGASKALRKIGSGVAPAPRITCKADYQVNRTWTQDGKPMFRAAVRVRNTGAPVDHFRVEWAFDGSQTVRRAWRADFEQTARRVRAWGEAVEPTAGRDQVVRFSVIGSGEGTEPDVLVFNGVVCE